MNINIRYQPFEINFQDHRLLSIKGPDSKDYLQRQLTSDLDLICSKQGQLSCRLDRNGRVESFFYLLNIQKDEYLILVNENLLSHLEEDLNKFHIMEDLEIKRVDKDFFVFASPENIEGYACEFSWCDLRVFLCFEKRNISSIDVKACESLIMSSAWPVLNKTVETGKLVNDYRLNELAVSYDKGCFLGQETVAKINTRRGAAFYPMLVETGKDSPDLSSFGKEVGSFESDSRFYKLIQMKREYRVEGSKLLDKYHVLTAPLYKDITSEEKAKKLYLDSVRTFHSGDKETAVEMLNIAIALSPNYADAYESKGAILGQLEKYEEAIGVMDQLLEVDENSVMAHTNKSLFLMKMGKIEEAEEEKALATVANFKKLGDQAKAKKEKEALEQKEIEQQNRQEQMFIKVLGLDEEDEIANFGLGSILYKKGKYLDSVKHLEIVLKNNENYSAAYLLLGKSYQSLGKKEKAIALYKKGIEVASKQGDLMPANEMQSKLNTLESNA